MSYNPNNPNGSALSANSAPVVIANDQGAVPNVLPMVIAQPASQSLSATGSIQWTVQPGGWYYLTINNAPAATATFVATIVFETSPDNSSWSAVNGSPMIGLPGAGMVPASSTTTVGLWKVLVPGNASYVRARVSARTSGTIWAYLEPVGVPNGTIQLPFTPSVTSGSLLVGWLDSTGMSEIVMHVSAVTTTVVSASGTNDPTGAVAQGVALSGDNSTGQTPVTTMNSPMTGSLVNPIHKWIRFAVNTTGTIFTIQGVTARFGQSFKLAGNQSTISLPGGTTNVNAITSLTTLSTMTKGNIGNPTFISDVASSPITTTTTTGLNALTYGNSYQISLQMTAVSGTTPTYDLQIQESRDGGSNYIPVYDFPRISAVGTYNSPLMTATGTVMRYVQTVGGTTPSFTRALLRIQSSAVGAIIRQMIDRSVSLTTLSSTTPNVIAEQGTKNVQLTINIGAVTTTAPALQIQASDDTGATWYSIGSPLTAVASSTVSATINNVTAQMYRAIVTTAGSGVTAGYVLLRAF
jgi:hypothetical protein